MNLSLNFAEINWLSVIVVTIISFPLGAFWHSSVLFGKAWKEFSKPTFDESKKSNFVKLFGLSAVLHFIAVTGLDLLIGTDSTFLIGFYTGLAISILWVFTSIGSTYLFVGRPIKLLLIDAGFYIVFFSIAGMILGAW